MSKKTRTVLFGIYIVAIFSMITSATLAYFTYVEVSSVSPEIKTTTATIMDMLVFDVENNIYIHASSDNFAQGMDSLSSETNATASLQITGNEGAEKVYEYNIILDITDNEFVYSTSNNTPELLVKVTDPEGNEVIQIPGLNYVSSNGFSGFDITTALGSFNLVSNYEIATASQVTQTWNVEVIFVNLNTNQDINTGKSFGGILKMETVDSNG